MRNITPQDYFLTPEMMFSSGNFSRPTLSKLNKPTTVSKVLRLQIEAMQCQRSEGIDPEAFSMFSFSGTSHTVTHLLYKHHREIIECVAKGIKMYRYWFISNGNLNLLSHNLAEFALDSGVANTSILKISPFSTQILEIK